MPETSKPDPKVDHSSPPWSKSRLQMGSTCMKGPSFCLSASISCKYWLQPINKTKHKQIPTSEHTKIKDLTTQNKKLPLPFDIRVGPQMWRKDISCRWEVQVLRIQTRHDFCAYTEQQTTKKREELERERKNQERENLCSKQEKKKRKTKTRTKKRKEFVCEGELRNEKPWREKRRRKKQ